MSGSGPPGRAGEFFTLLEELRVFRAGPLASDPSDRALARAAGVSPTTIGDWLRGAHFPQDIGQVLAVVRTVQQAANRRGVATPGSGSAGLLDEDRWRAAYQQEAQRRAGVISGGVEQVQAVWALAGPRVRVKEADLRLLGVHAAISVPGVPDEVPPEYVPRDVDAAEFGVRAKVAAAAQRGGLVLLVGGSSVGKTRCAAETVKALLPDWWLVHPAGLAEMAALAQAPPPRTVVWLDELQRYLDGEHGLTGPVVRALLTATHPVVIIGTLWPDRYNAFTTVPAPGAADPCAREREVLELAAVIRIAPEFSAAEQDRARAAATRDRRLAVALKAAGYGLTQTLAAAPQLVARWQDAKTTDPYAWAVLTAALDAARLGARAPLSPDLLRAAAPGYCTSQQQAEALANWFEQALAYATEKLRGAAAALSPVGAGMGQLAGYTIADYLIQHANRERRYVRVPASSWDAVLSYGRDPADTARLADSARDRLLYCYAIPLYRHAADAGDEHAARQLAELLARRGDLDGLRARADVGDEHAAERLAGLLADRDDLDGLRARADTGDRYATRELAELLEARGDLAGAAQILRAAADTGDEHAAERLAALLADLAKRDGVDKAAQKLRAAADTGDEHAAERLAALLADLAKRDDLGEVAQDAAREVAGWLYKRGDLDGLRELADTGDRYATWRLVDLLKERGDVDGTAQMLLAVSDAYAGARDRDAWEMATLLFWRGELDLLRKLADAGDRYAARRLVELLEKRGDVDGAAQILRKRADAGDEHAAWELARLLSERGDLDGAAQILRKRADAGDEHAAWELARLLSERGDLDGAAQILRKRADAGDEHAAWELARLLSERGDLDGLRARADTGDKHAARELARLLAGRGDLDGLRARADTGDEHAARELVALFLEHGDLDGLRARADAGDKDAARRLVALLFAHGDLDGLRARADAGDEYAARELARLLARRGDLDGLCELADTGDEHAASRLAELFEARGDLDGLRARADAGHGCAARRLVALLFAHGDLDGLRAAADVGDEHAARRLAELLEARGDLDGLRARADTGDEHAAERLAGLLAGRGDLDGLRTRIDAGDEHAASRLAELLIEQGREEEAERLRRFGLNLDGSIACA